MLVRGSAGGWSAVGRGVVGSVVGKGVRGGVVGSVVGKDDCRGDVCTDKLVTNIIPIRIAVPLLGSGLWLLLCESVVGSLLVGGWWSAGR